MTAPPSAPSASRNSSPSERLPGGSGRRPPRPASRFRSLGLARLAACLLAAGFFLPLLTVETAQAQSSAVSSAVLTDDYIVTVNFTGVTNCGTKSAWTINYNGNAARPYRLECRGQSVVLYSRTHNQSPALAKHRTVTVSYEGSRLRFADGSVVANFSDVSVTNEYPLLAGASVDGNVLTLTYDQPLDERSVPPFDAFGVDMASNRLTRFAGSSTANDVVGVSISGAAVTLALAEPVPHDANVSMTYSPPGSNPLRNPAGGNAKAITGSHYDTLPVTVLTPASGEPPAFIAAGVERYREPWLLMVFDETLDSESEPAAGAFSVRATSASGGSRAIATTGDVVVQHDEVRIRLSGDIPESDSVTVSYVKPSANPLRDPEGNEVESFGAEPASNGTSRILSVALVSDAGADNTYRPDDKVRVRVTFDTPVRVVGAPRLQLSMGRSHPEKNPSRGGYHYSWADYEGGSGTPTLTFAYTVKELDRSDGVAVWVEAGGTTALDLNGGRIITPWSWRSLDADLSHPWLPYDASHRVDGALPSFQSAAVDWKTLTLTFDQTLETSPVPAPGAFHVTVNGARRNVIAGGVAIAGRTVTLTLASAVSRGDTVGVRYTKPSAGPLQGVSGNAVDTFADQAVTNNTVAGTIWSATLTAGVVVGEGRGCWNGFATECSNALDEDSFTTGGTTYRVVTAARGLVGHQGEYLAFALDKAISRDWTLHVGALRFSVADATLRLNDKIAHWTKPAGPSFANRKISLRLTTGGGSGGLSGASGNAGAEPASVTGVSVVSSAGADQTYGIGDTIHVRVTFDAPVDVTGSPRLKIDMDPAHWGEKWATYASGAGTSSLTFAHTVVEPNLSTQGIAVLANTLALNGGTIRANGAAVALAHDGLAHDSNHKVDWQTQPEGSGPVGTGGSVGLSTAATPSVTGVSVVSSPASGDTYMLGERIRIRATFSEPVQVIGSPRLSIDMDPAHWGTKQVAYVSGSGTSSLDFDHTVVEPNYSTQGIAVLADTLALNGGTIRSAATHAEAALGHSGLGHDPDHKVDWRPTISVADARANEGAGATVAFEVSLSRAFTGTSHRVTVDYATADGSATAGEDYTATSGTLAFAAGETSKTVNVPVLDDAVDEGEETFVLRLSNAAGARIADGEATGTIANDDPLQKMWLSRFGRTVAIQTIEALEGRFALASQASPRMTMTVAGQGVDLVGDGAALAETLTGLARAFGAPDAANDDGPFARRGFGGGEAGASATTRRATGRELLLGSSFHFTTGEASGLGGAMTGWGKVLSGGSNGSSSGGLSFASETATGVLGMDWERDRLLVGVALSRSLETGSASFAPTGSRYDIEGSLSMVTPYMRLGSGERLSFWGAVGSGSGTMSLSQGAGWQTADIAMRLAAAGARAELLRPGGGLALALKTDAFFVRTESERVSTPGLGNLAAATGDASRVRAVLEGSRRFALAGGGALEPSLELGLRHDGGDAETGTGVEFGGGVSWTDPGSGLTVEAKARMLAAHADRDYEEWGVSGAVRLSPGERGRGFSFSLAPTLGAASSGSERLWGARDARGLAPGTGPGAGAGGGFEAARGLRGELGYGLALSGDRLTGTPSLGFGLSDSTRDYRIGWRLTPAAPGGPAFEVSLDATRREPANDNGAAEHGVGFRLTARW